MERSTAVRDALLGFYRGVSTKDIASFERIVSSDPATLIIGTAPGEWVTERPGLRYGFEAEGLRIDAGERPDGYAEGSVGWAVDEPTMTFPDGSRMRTRLTALFRREDGAWKVVHMHWSVGVPDEEVVELQRRWAGERSPSS